jgi:hypothetical protein
MKFLGVTICSTTLSAMCYLFCYTECSFLLVSLFFMNLMAWISIAVVFKCVKLWNSKHISKFWYGKHDFVLCRVSQKFVTIVLTFSLKIILRQFLSPFHKDYLTRNVPLYENHTRSYFVQLLVTDSHTFFCIR